MAQQLVSEANGLAHERAVERQKNGRVEKKKEHDAGFARH